MQATIAFIGAGNMASAIIGGLINTGVAAGNIRAADPYQPSLDKLAQNCGMLEQWIDSSAAIVRCMPNTPALVQTGATGLFANAHVSASQKTQADALLQAIGIVNWVAAEAQLDAVTALSGSGPAYFFLVMEAMQAAGEALGLDAETARSLTLQTALGAARMAIESDVDAAELRRRFTSPGGTTAAALSVFEEAGLRQLFLQALTAADERSKTLASEMLGGQ